MDEENQAADEEIVTKGRVVVAGPVTVAAAVVAKVKVDGNSSQRSVVSGYPLPVTRYPSVSPTSSS